MPLENETSQVMFEFLLLRYAYKYFSTSYMIFKIA